MSPSHSHRGSEESTWFQGLGTAAAALTGKVCGHAPPERAATEPEEPRQWCSFEFAQLLEEGRGPGLTSRFVDPPRASTQPQSLRIQRSQNRSDFQLTTNKGCRLLVAHGNVDGTHYDLFIAPDVQSPRALGPAFTLKSNPSHESWSLHSVRCEQCESRGKRQCGVRELACMTHYCEAVGAGQAFCVDVDIPSVREDGACAVSCPVCSDPSELRMQTITSRRPRWNPKHRSLTLDFGGRCTLASAKNFQLEMPDKPGKAQLLCGKVGPNEFVLDYWFPLSAVQAFAVVLSASHWK